jgi:hypothetical protein
MPGYGPAAVDGPGLSCSHTHRPRMDLKSRTARGDLGSVGVWDSQFVGLGMYVGFGTSGASDLALPPLMRWGIML